MMQQQTERRKPAYSFFRQLSENFRKNRFAYGALWGLYLLIALALFGDFIANDKPLYCRIEGKTTFPVFQELAIDLGLRKADKAFFNVNWRELAYERVIFPPIPYAAGTIDRNNMRPTSPWGTQRLESWKQRHWLGTDEIGRDVAAGLISGTRTALLVGVFSMTIAGILGIFFGLMAGYFGDEGLQIRRAYVIMNSLALLPAIFFGFVARSYPLAHGIWYRELFWSFAIAALVFTLFNLAAAALVRIRWMRQRVKFPVDLLVMRLIEITNSVPGLLLILAILAVLERQSIFYVMAIIGCIQWTSIARFVRSELLRIRNLDYIKAAQAMGFSNWRIIWKHALPNGLRPVLITMVFGMAGAILLEAFLSFLGIGLPPDAVTWGTLMRKIQGNIGAWWLAVFPGMAIFITVTIFNLIGEGLTEALDPKQIE